MPSKISIHLSGYTNRTFDILTKMQPGIVKVYNQSSEMNIDTIRRLCPGAVFIYRQYTNLDYHSSADKYLAELSDTLNKLRGRGILWEGLNEPVVKSVEDAQALNAWYVRFAQVLHSYGELAAGFSWSTGNPEPEILDQIIPSLTQAAANLDVHTFHEYYSTWGKQKDWGRYRAFEAALPASARKPVVITEAGLDDNGDPYSGGYKGKVSVQQYVEILKVYDALLLQDSYVLGAAVYEWGDGGWPSFELEPMMGVISDYVASVGGGLVTPKPWPIPEFGVLPPAYSFSVSPTSILSGQDATLQWDVDGASQVYLADQLVTTHGTKVVAPTQTTTYNLHILFYDGSSKDLAATLMVNDAPQPSFSFSASPDTILVGQSATLAWAVEGVREVYLDGQSVSGRESRVVTPAQTTTYVLRVVMVDGSSKDLSASVTVVPQPSYTLAATPGSITSGQSSTLAWTVVGARAVTLQGQPVEAKGSTIVTPTQTTTYVLHLLFWDNSTKDLTATITVLPVPEPTCYLSVNPATIVVGTSAALQWGVSSCKSVMLDGQTVGLQGTRMVAPTQTTLYALNVIFEDGTAKDLTATLTVTSQALVPRGPTVVLTPENMAMLRTYPRPAQDNGRGLHFTLDLRDSGIQTTVEQLVSINARWTLIYAPDEIQAGRAAKGCWAAGIMPVIRIGKRVDESFDPVMYVNALKSVGVPPYIQIYNEPGDSREWKNYPGDSWISVFAPRWARMATAVYDAGGYPGLQVLAKQELDATIDAVKTTGRTDIWQRAFFALHNYGANHPPAYPYDPRNQQDRPGATIFTDDVSVLAFLEFAKWMQDKLGFVLPMIGGEGGWQFGAAEDARYPRAEQPFHARFHSEMFDWFHTGKLSNGEPLPDYLFSVTPWIAAGWGADNWWGGPLGDKTETINAVRAIPSFVRRFDWETVPPPVAAASFVATPTTISVGSTATLQWEVTGARSVSLDGQNVAARGSLVVTPSQTTTYLLSIVFLDGSTRELRTEVSVSAPPPPPALDWDPRLDALRVRLVKSRSTQAWRLVAAKYQSESEAGGNHHVYFKALNRDGAPVSDIKFVVDWFGRDPRDDAAVVKTDWNGEANIPLWSGFDPTRQSGPYFAYGKGVSSDQVEGLGLPGGRSANYLLTYKWDDGSVTWPPPPSTSASFTATPASVTAGGSSTLQWSTTGARTLSLDGETVPFTGTRVVSPAQTTTHVLHVVFADGTSRDLSATVTVFGTTLPPGVIWDPRLDPLGVKLERSTASKAWHLIAAKYQDETESGGNHHIYYKILNEDGSPASNVQLVVDWNGRDPHDQAAVVTTDWNGEANCALWSILHPEWKDGPYFTYVKDMPSDKVKGMGLPVNRHVNFLLTYRLQ